MQCTSTDASTVATIDKEVSALNTIKKQTLFLEDIGKLDQDIRAELDTQISAFGYESDEHLVALQQMKKIDQINLSKIESFFKYYGHPRLQEHGKDATMVPRIVVHHAPTETNPRRRNFKYLYTAFKNGDIDDGELTFYLNRMYHIAFGRRIDWDGPFTVQDELDTLFTALDLYPILNQLEDSIDLQLVK